MMDERRLAVSPTSPGGLRLARRAGGGYLAGANRSMLTNVDAIARSVKDTEVSP
jgi:hypothetical protein